MRVFATIQPTCDATRACSMWRFRWSHLLFLALLPSVESNRWREWAWVNPKDGEHKRGGGSWWWGDELEKDKSKWNWWSSISYILYTRQNESTKTKSRQLAKSGNKWHMIRRFLRRFLAQAIVIERSNVFNYIWWLSLSMVSHQCPVPICDRRKWSNYMMLSIASFFRLWI